MCLKTMVCRSVCCFERVLKALTPWCDLVLRFWLWDVFFMAALNKWQSWNTTLALFEYEYSVPIVSPWFAAITGTWIELVTPWFLLLGLGGRIPAFVLFVFNFVALWSYPFLWTDAGRVGFEHHVYWGMMLAVVMSYGTQCLSVDALLKRYCCAKSCTR